MNAHIPNAQKSMYNIKTENTQYAVFQVLSVITGEYVDTSIKLFYSDISLNTRAHEVLVKLGDINDSLTSKVNVDDIKAEAEKQAIAAKESTGLSDNDISAVQAYAMSAAILMTHTQIANTAKIEFDKLFGEGALDSVVTAQFGRTFTPDLLTICQYISVISTLGTTLTTKHLGDAYDKLKSSADKYAERFNSNV